MSTRTDSYVGSNGQILTSGSFAGQAALVGSGRVKVVAADTQFDLTGSNAGNHSFMHNAAESDTVFTFADGSEYLIFPDADMNNLQPGDVIRLNPPVSQGG